MCVCVPTGSKFWRSAKKVRAVSKDDFCAFTKKGKCPLPVPSDSDDDFLPPFPKPGTSKEPLLSSMVPTGGHKMSEKVQALEFRVRKIESQHLQQDDQEKVTLREQIVELMKAKDDLQVQVACGLSEITSFRENNSRLMRQHSAITRCFDCMICTNTVSWPCMKSPCCDVIIGCNSCVSRWLENSSVCPHCRSSITLNQCTTIPFIRPLADHLGSNQPILLEESD